jgi:hypothetical protein
MDWMAQVMDACLPCSRHTIIILFVKEGLSNILFHELLQWLRVAAYGS